MSRYFNCVFIYCDKDLELSPISTVHLLYISLDLNADQSLQIAVS